LHWYTGTDNNKDSEKIKQTNTKYLNNNNELLIHIHMHSQTNVYNICTLIAYSTLVMLYTCTTYIECAVVADINRLNAKTTNPKSCSENPLEKKSH